MAPLIHPPLPRDGRASYRHLCLLATFLAIIALGVVNFNDELRSLGLESGAPYEPLVGARGDIYEDIVHPRVASLAGIDDSGIETNGIDDDAKPREAKPLPSIPKRQGNSAKGGGETAVDVPDLYPGETDECKLSDPSYQTVPAAPPTCNDIHALGFRFGPAERGDPFEREPASRVGRYAYPSRHKMRYLTSGGFRSVWTVSFLDDLEDTQVVMKTNQMRRDFSSDYLDQNRRDVLISERAGNSPTLSNLLPVHKYCAFSSVVPFATAGVLDDYVRDRLDGGDPLSAVEQYHLARMAARGLYQTHLYSGGRATHAHADVKPPQFLLFQQSPQKNENASTTVQSGMPIMQINDFNRGRFLTRSVETNETCPFRMCHVHHKGSLYRSPEEYMECADQSDRIDVFSLAGVFYYIMSDGEKPWYYVNSYQKGVDAILRGEHPRLPDIKEYKEYGEKIMKKVKHRSKHPLLVELKNVMRKCWAFKPKDRPSSLQVVRMLEDKWHEINPPIT